MMTEQPIETDPQSREQYWEKQIELWEASKLTQAEFCRRNGFKSSKFLYWKTKLRKSQKSNISFVQIPVGATNDLERYESNVSPIRIVIRDRFQVEIGPAFDPGTLQRLIYTLERL
jgi:hypothetical protein